MRQHPGSGTSTIDGYISPGPEFAGNDLLNADLSDPDNNPVTDSDEPLRGSRTTQSILFEGLVG